MQREMPSISDEARNHIMASLNGRGRKRMEKKEQLALLTDLQFKFPADRFDLRRLRRTLTALRVEKGIAQRQGSAATIARLDGPVEDLIADIFNKARLQAIDVVKIAVADERARSDEEIEELKKELEAKCKMLRALKDVRQAVENFKGFES